MKTPTTLLLLALLSFFGCNVQSTAPKAETASNIMIGDTVSTMSNNIMVVFQDRQNNYWFGSWEDGLYKWDGKTILHYSTENGLPHNHIEEIKEDNTGRVFINTSAGLLMYDAEKFTPINISSASSTWQLSPNDLWFKNSYATGHILRWDGQTLHKLALPKHPDHTTAYDVYSVYKDTQGNMWFGTNPLGAFRFDGKNFDWISTPDVTELHNGPANGVRSIIQDSEGYFWFNTLYRYKVYGNPPGQNPFYTREESIGNLDNNPNSDLNEYLFVTHDNNNTLWFATYNDGVWHYDGKNISHPVLENGQQIHIFSIYKDRQGKLWLATHENGAYFLNDQNEFERFTPSN